MYRHPDAKITGEGTPTATGYLEVTVDGVLVHSKDNGDGYVDTAEKMEKILEAVRKGSYVDPAEKMEKNTPINGSPYRDDEK